jgi:hypothetical protein
MLRGLVGCVAESGVSVVLATERDRFVRQPEIIYLLRKELAQRGAQLTEGMLDQIAQFFRATFAEKSRENKVKKAREGKASDSGAPPYRGSGGSSLLRPRNGHGPCPLWSANKSVSWGSTWARSVT